MTVKHVLASKKEYSELKLLFHTKLEIPNADGEVLMLELSSEARGETSRVDQDKVLEVYNELHRKWKKVPQSQEKLSKIRWVMFAMPAIFQMKLMIMR